MEEAWKTRWHYEIACRTLPPNRWPHERVHPLLLLRLQRPPRGHHCCQNCALNVLCAWVALVAHWPESKCFSAEALEPAEIPSARKGTRWALSDFFMSCRSALVTLRFELSIILLSQGFLDSLAGSSPVHLTGWAECITCQHSKGN